VLGAEDPLDADAASEQNFEGGHEGAGDGGRIHEEPDAPPREVRARLPEHDIATGFNHGVSTPFVAAGGPRGADGARISPYFMRASAVNGISTVAQPGLLSIQYDAWSRGYPRAPRGGTIHTEGA
jgi:hypothetical protein